MLKHFNSLVVEFLRQIENNKLIAVHQITDERSDSTVHLARLGLGGDREKMKSFFLFLNAGVNLIRIKARRISQSRFRLKRGAESIRLSRLKTDHHRFLF